MKAIWQSCAIALFAPSAFAIAPCFDMPTSKWTPSASLVSPAVGDFNHDGKKDFAAVTDGALMIYLGTGGGSFAAPVSYAIADAVYTSVGDFNDDGFDDVAVSRAFGSNPLGLAILLGDGTGALSSPATYSSMIWNEFATGDLNHDGRSDIVGHDYGSSYSPGAVEVMLATPDGGLSSPVAYGVGNFPSEPIVADFNGDGSLDIATANIASNNVSWLLGNGDGTFQPAQQIAVPGYYPNVDVAGDFDGDGHIDLAVSSTSVNSPYPIDGIGVITVFINNGAGGFRAPATYTPIGIRSYSLHVADLDGDGKPEIVCRDYALPNVFVLRNQGDGTFAGPALYSAGPRLSDVAVADFTGDGFADVLATNSPSRGGLAGFSLLRSRGDGTLRGAPYVYSGDQFVLSAVTADFNGDGHSDWAMTGTTGVLVATGAGNGTFPEGTLYDAGSSPVALVTADFNNDGKPDIAVTNGPLGTGASTVSVLINSGSGFAAAVPFPSGGTSPYGIAAFDANGDGNIDLVIVNANQNLVSVLIGDGHGSFAVGNSYPAGSGALRLTVADFNLDSKPDFAVANGTSSVRVFLGNGDATFQSSNLFVVDPQGQIAAGDVDRDGKPDLVVSTNSGSTLVFHGNGNGTFGTPQFVSIGSLDTLLLADFSGDGRLDLVTTTSLGVFFYQGNGDRTFNYAASLAPGSTTYAIATADFDEDGRVDLISGAWTGGAMSVYLNRSYCIPTFDPSGDGRFSVTDVFYLVNDLFGNGAAPLGIADASGDGVVTGADIFYAVDALFAGGPAPH